MTMTYIDMCRNGSADQKDWKKWLDENKKDGDRDNELLGLLQEECDDLMNGIRSMGFYVFKSRFVRSIRNIWTGCYVRYLFEYDGHEPHFEIGWVDAVNNQKGFCKIQCDDCYNGNRAVTIRTIDVMEILPHKERPLVYYKTMMCGDCYRCDHSSNEVPAQDCPNHEFMNAILGKQKGDSEFIRLYDKVVGNDVRMGGCSCEHCDGKCGHAE